MICIQLHLLLHCIKCVPWMTFTVTKTLFCTQKKSFHPILVTGVSLPCDKASLRTALTWLQSTASYCPQNNAIPQGAFTNPGKRLSSTQQQPKRTLILYGLTLNSGAGSIASRYTQASRTTKKSRLSSTQWGMETEDDSDVPLGLGSIRIHVLKSMELKK